VNPIPVLAASEAAAWDSAARTQYRIPSRVLMETAGRAIVQVLVAEFPAAASGGVLVAAGAGNNGGDGWVIARALHTAGIPVWVASVDPKTDDAIDNRALARVDGVRELGREEPWPQAGVAVDALLGTGAVGPAKGDVLALAQRIAEYGAPIVAVDGPTGLDLTSGEAHGPLHAQLTVTFGGPRRGHLLAREWCRGKDVLDVASGEGYGTWMLAQVARSAVGVELARDAVEHATRSYCADNLRFLQGDARDIPLEDASLDVVVSFETIEHFAEQPRFVAEVRRVLRPDGTFIVSTPDRDNYSPTESPANPYHVQELTRSEFEQLLQARFSNVGIGRLA